MTQLKFSRTRAEPESYLPTRLGDGTIIWGAQNQDQFEQLKDNISISEFDDGGTGVEVEDIGSPSTEITEPFDPKSVRVTPKYLMIDAIIKRIEHKEIVLQSGFQRKAGIWNEGAQSRLIESILVNIPLPAFYFDGSDDENWEIIDGLQRLTALKKFIIDGSLKLSGLEFLTKYQGNSFLDLPRSFQRRIRETQITAFVIQEDVSPNVKFHIFKRINTGGLPLSSQEIRHALNPGIAPELLMKMADSELFKKATAWGISDQRMADRECVLRFFSFTITHHSEYKEGDFNKFINNQMAKINNMSNDDIDLLKIKFKKAMQAAIDIFGYDAFRKRYHPLSARHPINKSLFETWSVNFGNLSDMEIKTLVEKKARVKEHFINLMLDSKFDTSISQGTGSVARVNERFGGIEHLIADVLS